VRGRVGTDARKGEQPLGDFVVGKLLGRRLAELLEVQRARRDRVGEGTEVRAAVAGPDDVLVEILARLGHRGGSGERPTVGAAPRGSQGGLAQMFDERADHADGCGPCAIRGGDRLDDVLEDGRATHQAAGAACGPGEVGVLANLLVEARKILVEAQDVADAVKQSVCE
jgi:hypothetical protein